MLQGSSDDRSPLVEPHEAYSQFDSFDSHRSKQNLGGWGSEVLQENRQNLPNHGVAQYQKPHPLNARGEQTSISLPQPDSMHQPFLSSNPHLAELSLPVDHFLGPSHPSYYPDLVHRGSAVEPNSQQYYQLAATHTGLAGFAVLPTQERSAFRPTLSLTEDSWARRDVWEGVERRRSSDEEYSPISPQIYPHPFPPPPLNPALSPAMSLCQPLPIPPIWQPSPSGLLTARLQHYAQQQAPPVVLSHDQLVERSPPLSNRSLTSSLAGRASTPYFDTPDNPLLGDPRSQSVHSRSSSCSSHEAHHLKHSPSLSSSPPDSIHPAIRFALSNRIRYNSDAHGTPASPTKPRRRPALQKDPQEYSDRRKGTRQTMDHDCICLRCGGAIARLIFRGTPEELNTDFRSRFFCISCEPLLEDAMSAEFYRQAQAEQEESASYADSLSAAIDKLQGIALPGTDHRPLPTNARALSVPNKKRTSSNGEVLICDVCTRVIATGAVTGADPREEVPFNIESICVTCFSRYSRCTDCGGGGGPRIGIGKWRCRELFPQGRKTCELSHLRLGLLSDMSYDVWPVDELPAGEVEELVKSCSSLYMHNMYSALATPETLEPVTALASSYAQLKSLALDSWAAVEPMLREKIEPERHIRRYLALRWSKPAQRKQARPAVKAASQTIRASTSTPGAEPCVMRKGKNLAGFVVAELDLLTGSLFLAVTTPWATGESFDATTLVMQNLLRRIESDINWLNAARQPLYPDLQNAWLLMFFKKDTRMMHNLHNRRSFLYLEDYLKQYPDTDRTQFAPYRPVFIPAEYLGGWHILVRSIVPNDDWNARPTLDRKSVN